MAHSAPPPSKPRRRLEPILGVLLVVVGVAVAALAVTALSYPSGRLAARASQSITSASAASHSASSPAPSPSESRVSASSSPAGGGRLPLIVLNNTSEVSASAAAQRFEQGG